MDKCTICKKAFKEGDMLHAFLRCPDDPAGSWTRPIRVDANFQQRCAMNKDGITRKHVDCGNHEERSTPIDKVADAILRQRAKFRALGNDDPSLAVYMTRDFYQECKAQIIGKVTYEAKVFDRSDSIMGYPLFLVASPISANEAFHPNYRVLEVE